jgi:hypothetical protein
MITLDRGEARTTEIVLYIPTLKKSLIFVCKVIGAGYRVESITDSCLIKDQESKTIIIFGKKGR